MQSLSQSPLQQFHQHAIPNPNSNPKPHRLFASAVHRGRADPHKSILPIFDEDNDLSSEPRSSYIIDLDLLDFDSRLIPSPQFHAVVNGLSLGASNNASTSGSSDGNSKTKTKTNNGTKVSSSPRPSLESLLPPPAVHDAKHQSFLELEADCSALQLDSEVIVLTRPRTMSKLPSAYLHSPYPPPSSRAPSPAAMRVQVQQQAVQLSDPGFQRGEVGGSGSGHKYQRKAPPQLQLKTSNYRRRSRRISAQLQLGENTAAYFVPHPAANLRLSGGGGGVGGPSLAPMPSPQHSVVSHTRTMTPISIKSFRFSYASSARCVGGGSGGAAARVQFSTKELHRRRILKLQRTFGERVPLELVTVSPRRRRPTSAAHRLSVVSYRAPAVFYPPFDVHGNGTPVTGVVRDWALDQIGPPVSAGGGGTLQSVLKLGVAPRQTAKGQHNALRKSQMMLKREEAEEGQPGASPFLLQVEEHDEDRGDNSIWLDEEEPARPKRKRASVQASGLLVFVNKSQSKNLDRVSRMAGVEYEDGQVVHPVHATTVSVSRPVSTQYHHFRQRSSMLLGPSRLGASPSPAPTPRAQAQAGPSRLAIASAASAPFDVDAAFPEGSELSYCDSPASSPSMPAFRNIYEVEESEENAELHRHPINPALDLSAGSTQSQGQPVAPPRGSAAAAAAAAAAAGQFSVGHTPSNSYTSDGHQQMGGLLDVPEHGGSGTRRRERRQGWSGEWNQPTIKDVIQKLRDI